MLRIVLAVVLAASASFPVKAAEPQRPNVVMILVDDLGYGDVGCFGSADLRTPHLDGLARRGMRMTNFYANCPVCSPTRASLMTGRYPDCVGVPGVIRTHAANSWGYLRPNAVMLPDLLAKAGYQTAMVGKWHLGLGEPNLPNRRGFGYFYGFLGDMMDDYWTHLRHGVNYMRRNEETIDPKGHATDLFSDAAAEWIAKYDGRSPFFLYLAYNAPHDPIQPPPDWLARFKQRHPEASEKRAKLAAFIEHMDDGIGRVLAALEKSRQAANTLVLFASDNGGVVGLGANNGPLSGGKQQMLEGGLRVSFIAAWPGKIAPGTTSDRVALTMDLFPTICEAAGAEFTHAIDGRSILPTLVGTRQPAEQRDLFWVRLEGGGYRGQPYYAARRGEWKLLQNKADEPLRLLNLNDDPKESADRSAEKPEIYAALKQSLDAHKARCAKVPYRSPDGAGPGELPASR